MKNKTLYLCLAAKANANGDTFSIVIPLHGLPFYEMGLNIFAPTMTTTIHNVPKRDILALAEHLDEIGWSHATDPKPATPTAGEVINIQNGEIHVDGFYEENDNDYGPHPFRYVEICGLYLSLGEFREQVRDYSDLVELEARCTQYPQDGEEDTDEATIARYMKDRSTAKTISLGDLANGLPDGDYFLPQNEPFTSL